MTIDIHKIISNNKISRNLLKPWGSVYDENSNKKSLGKNYLMLIQDQRI